MFCQFLSNAHVNDWFIFVFDFICRHPSESIQTQLVYKIFFFELMMSIVISDGLHKMHNILKPECTKRFLAFRVSPDAENWLQ